MASDRGLQVKLTPEPPVAPSSPAAARQPVTPNSASSTRSAIVVFSGGSAANSLVDVFEQVRAANQTALSYVIPISDNGGSTSEIIRVFGGPGISDLTACRSPRVLAVHTS